MPKSESRVSAAQEQKVPKDNVKYYETKIKWLPKMLLIQSYQQILGKILCFASERRLIVRFHFRYQILLVFIHQTVKLRGKTG